MNLYELTETYAGMIDRKRYVVANSFAQAADVYETQKEEYEPMGISKIKKIARDVLIPQNCK